MRELIKISVWQTILSTYEEVFGAKVVSDLNPFSYRRRLQPRLDWRAAKKIDIDFNQQPGARFLVGTLIFRNEGRVPWFGRLLRNKDYPDYKVKFSLD